MRLFRYQKHTVLSKWLAVAIAAIFFAGIVPLVPIVVGVANAQSAPAASTAPASTPATSSLVGNALNLLGTAAQVVSPAAGEALTGLGTATNGLAATPGGVGGAAGTIVSGILGNTVAAVATFLFYLSGFLFGIVGMMFNWVVVLTVFQFGAYFGNSAGMLIAWGVLRDIGNIILLFGFIFMGVLMILDLHNGIDSKKAIPSLIIFAVLLNFSLFASEAIVDVSNVLSAAIFNQAGQCTTVNCTQQNNQTSAISTNTTGSAILASTNTGISGVIITELGLATLFHPSAKTQTALDGNPVNTALFDIGAALFVTIAMVVLLAGVIMLLVRAVTLAFLLVVSPIGFAAMAIPIPAFKSIAEKWWHTLLSQSFFAPVFLLLILVSIKILTGIGSISGGVSLADAIANPSSSTLGIFLVFALMIGFFVAALMTAKSMGALGADFATNVAKNTVTSTVSAPFRAGAYGAGIGINRVAGGAARRAGGAYNTMIGNAVKQGGVTGRLAKVFDHTAGGSITGTLDNIQKAKVGGARSYEEQKKSDAHRDHETSHASHLDHQTKDIKAGLAANATTAQKDAMERSLQQMTVKDKVKLMNTLSENELKGAAKVMSFAGFKELYNQEDLSSTAKGHLKSGKYGDYIAAAERHDFAALKDNNLTTRDMEFLTVNDPQVAINLVNTVDPATEKSVIKETVIEKVLEGDALTTSQRKDFEGARMYEKLNATTAGLNVPGITPAVRAALVGKIDRILSNIDKVGKANKDAIFAAADEVGLEKHHVQSIIAEGKIKGPDVDTLLGKIQNYHDTHKRGPGYSMAKLDEFTKLKTHIETNLVAKSFFNGSKLAL